MLLVLSSRSGRAHLRVGAGRRRLEAVAHARLGDEVPRAGPAPAPACAAAGPGRPAGSCVSRSYVGPHTCCRSWRCVTSRPGWRTSTSRMLPLGGRQVDLVAVAVARAVPPGRPGSPASPPPAPRPPADAGAGRPAAGPAARPCRTAWSGSRRHRGRARPPCRPPPPGPRARRSAPTVHPRRPADDLEPVDARAARGPAARRRDGGRPPGAAPPRPTAAWSTS